MNAKRAIPVRERNIVLIGFMGVGKTTIGQLVAKKLYRDFIDIDQEIEKDFNMTIPEIFEKKGEDFFRKTEKEYILDICHHKRFKIVSLGGDLLNKKKSGIAVWKTVSCFIWTCHGRTGSSARIY